MSPYNAASSRRDGIPAHRRIEQEAGLANRKEIQKLAAFQQHPRIDELPLEFVGVERQGAQDRQHRQPAE
jgi:hypothetical protein